MKNLLVLSALLLLTNTQFGQIQKGTYVPSFALNGLYSSSMTSDSAHTNKNYNWQAGLTLRYGKFIKDNVLLSGLFNYTKLYSSSKYNYTSTPYSNQSFNGDKNIVSVGVSLFKY